MQTQYWRAPVPFDQAQAWLEAHPPLGLKPAGTSSGGGPSPSDMTVGYGYTAPSTAQLQSPELEVGAAYLGLSSSAIRVDAVVIWTDPRPWPDNTAGKRIHVSVAQGCPASVVGVVGVANPGAALTASLLPAGSPTAALVCRFNGSDGPSGSLPAPQWKKLAHRARLSTTGATELARVVAAAPISRTIVPGDGRVRSRGQLPDGRRRRGPGRLLVPGPARRRPVGAARRVRRRGQRVHPGGGLEHRRPGEVVRLKPKGARLNGTDDLSRRYGGPRLWTSRTCGLATSRGCRPADALHQQAAV